MNTFRYFCKACRRNPFIGFLIILELFASFLLGSITFNILTTNYTDTSYYFDGIEEYWYVGMSPTQYDALKEKGYGAQYPLYYPCKWGGDSFPMPSVFAISQSFVRQYGLEMLQGEWLDAFEPTTDTFSVVVNDHFTTDDRFQDPQYWKRGDEYDMPLYNRDGEIIEVPARVQGVTNFSETKRNIYIGPTGVRYDAWLSDMAYVLVPDGYDDFAYYDLNDSRFNQPICTLIQGLEAEEHAALIAVGAKVSNLGETLKQQYLEDRAANNLFILIFVGALLLAASTIVTSTAIQLRLRMKENAIAYICGMTLKQRFVTELVRCVLIFLIPFSLAGGLIALTLESNMLMMDSMTSFWIVLPIVFAVYVLANIASFIIQVKAKPLDGIKEN